MRRLVSPVFTKELRQIGNSRRAFILRCVWLGLLLAVWLSLLAMAVRHGVHNARTQAEVGEVLMVTIVLGQLTMAVLFSPLITAGAVAGEREANTLGLLFLTRLNAWQIVQDKALARLMQMLWLCLLTVPFMFAAELFGGVDMGQIVICTVYVFASILVTGAVGLLCSTVLRHTVGAVVTSYAVLTFWLLIPPLATSFWLKSVTATCAVSPYTGVTIMLVKYLSGNRSDAIAGAWWYLGGSAVLYLVVVGLAAWRLRRSTQRSPSRWSPTRVVGWLLDRPMSLYPILWFTRLRPGRNPVFWRELDLRRSYLAVVVMRLVHVMMLVAAGVAAAILIAEHRAWMEEEFYLLFYAFSLPIAGLFVVLLAASSMVQDRRSGTLDLLLSSGLTARHLARGILWGQLAVANCVLLPTLVPLILCGLITETWPNVWVALVLHEFYALVFVAVALNISARSGALLRSLVLSVGFYLLVMLGVPLLLVMIDPVIAFEDVLLGLWPPMPIAYMVVPDGMAHMGGDEWAAIALAAVVYGTLGIVACGRFVWRFNRLVGRR